MNERLSRLLLPGERVVWEGRPATGLIFRPIDSILIPFSLMWFGFAIFWNAGVWLMPAGWVGVPFRLFGLPFLIIGLYVTFGRFWFDMRARRTLRYAVTDRRLLFFRDDRTSGVKSIDLARLLALELDERADGSGTIRFGPAGDRYNDENQGAWRPTADPIPQFIRIPDVRRVYQLIQQATRPVWS